MGPSSSNGTTPTASARQAGREGEAVPWQYLLPLQLTLIELLLLAPTCLTERLRMIHNLLNWLVDGNGQQQRFGLLPPDQRPANSPPLDTVKRQVQLCVESVWLQLGPLLLSLCRRSSGEAVGEEEDEEERGPLLSKGYSSDPRQVFAAFTWVLMSMVNWQCEHSH